MPVDATVQQHQWICIAFDKLQVNRLLASLRKTNARQVNLKWTIDEQPIKWTTYMIIVIEWIHEKMLTIKNEHA